MYEMKGALSGCGPGSASFPASRLRVSQSPGFTVPDRLVSQPHRPRSTGHPASLFRFVRLPGFPGATRRPPGQTPAANSGFPAFASPRGKPPGWCPFPAVKVFLRPPPGVAQEPTAIHFRFFSCPHLVHRIPPVIRTSRQLSTALCTDTPQLTRRNSENTSDDHRFVFTPSFPDDSPLILNSRPRLSLPHLPPSNGPSPSSASPSPVAPRYLHPRSSAYASHTPHAHRSITLSAKPRIRAAPSAPPATSTTSTTRPGRPRRPQPIPPPRPLALTPSRAQPHPLVPLRS
jgi:hypothetical protein